MFEEGLITLTKIVSLLIFCIGAVPLLFLVTPGADKSEPEDVFETD